MAPFHSIRSADFMRYRSRVLLSALGVIILVAAVGLGYYAISSGQHVKSTVSTSFTSTTSSVRNSTTSSVLLVTGTSVDTQNDTFLTSCFPSGGGGFEFRIISDSTNETILQGLSVNAVAQTGCSLNGQPPEIQMVYLNNFSVGAGGWLTPISPPQASTLGNLSFVVAYQGKTYDFSSSVPPVGSNCTTLSVPSGDVSTVFTMNGPC